MDAAVTRTMDVEAAHAAPAPFAGLRLNVAQQGDALVLLRSLPDGYTPLVFFDPQHRAIMDKKKYGNEGARQRERAHLPQMLEDYIDACCIEIARVLKSSGYLMRWMDKYLGTSNNTRFRRFLP